MEPITSEELAAVMAAYLLIESSEGKDDGARLVRYREVWPQPSPWRWAGSHHT